MQNDGTTAAEASTAAHSIEAWRERRERQRPALFGPHPRRIGRDASAQVAAVARGKVACEILTVADLTKAVGTAVAVEQDASGLDPDGRDNCVWSGGGVTVTFQAQRRTETLDRDLEWNRMRSNAFGNMDAGTAVPGLGEAALYRDWGGGVKGGATLARKGQVLWVLSGNVSREVLVGLARTAESRL